MTPSQKLSLFDSIKTLILPEILTSELELTHKKETIYNYEKFTINTKNTLLANIVFTPRKIYIVLPLETRETSLNSIKKDITTIIYNYRNSI